MSELYCAAVHGRKGYGNVEKDGRGIERKVRKQRRSDVAICYVLPVLE